MPDGATAEGSVRPPVVVAVRLPMPTGRRRNEIVALRRKDVALEILERQQAIGLEPIDASILLHLAPHWWEEDNAPHPSGKSIAAAAGARPCTVQRRTAAMESGGPIGREERRTASNTYKTNLWHFDGLVQMATPYAKEASEEQKRRRKEDSERIIRRGRPRPRPRPRVVSKEA